MYYIESPGSISEPHYLHRGSVQARISAEVAFWLESYGVHEGLYGRANNLAPKDTCIKIAKAVLEGRCPYYLTKKAKRTLVETPSLFQSELKGYEDEQS